MAVGHEGYNSVVSHQHLECVICMLMLMTVAVLLVYVSFTYSMW